MPIDDDYATKFMGGDRVRFLDKVRAPWWLNAVLGVTGAAGVAATIAAGDPIAAGIVGGGSFLAWSVLTTMRVTVTDSHLHVQYGLFGPRIALADIAAVEVVDYHAMRYGGWGIRRSISGNVAYSMPGRGGKAVRITTTSGKVIEVTSEQPAALAAAINDAGGVSTSTTDSALDVARASLGVGNAPMRPTTVQVDANATVSAPSTKDA